MILKKLRTKKNWSQEQLAQMAGLSIRTVQRIEAGGNASIESLKSLSAVLEVSISTLEKEIIVIDKTTEEWKAVPYWLKAYYVGSSKLGIPERKLNMYGEIFCVIFGILLLLASPFLQNAFDSAWICFTAAYFISLFTRAGDKHKIW